MSAFWHVRVFCSENALGNASGVVLDFDGDRQQVAADIGLPDTIFLRRDGDEWETHAHSPTEELAVCIQGLIAAHAAIGTERTQFRTPAGRFTVEGRDIAWTSGACRILRPSVLDTGRIRMFKQVDSVEGIRMEPEHVMGLCRAERIHGFCVVARTGPRELALRVFTTSLEGREDASTGGAVLGLLPFLGIRDEEVWTVHQGTGRHRGTLYTRMRAGVPQVGGRFRPIARGERV